MGSGLFTSYISDKIFQYIMKLKYCLFLDHLTDHLIRTKLNPKFQCSLEFIYIPSPAIDIDSGSF